MAMLGRDVIALTSHLDIGAADWCGMTGMWLAAHAPGLIRRLVHALTAAHMPPPRLWDERSAAARGEGMEALATATVERWFPADFRSREPDTVARIRSVVVATPVAAPPSATSISVGI